MSIFKPEQFCVWPKKIRLRCKVVYLNILHTKLHVKLQKVELFHLKSAVQEPTNAYCVSVAYIQMVCHGLCHTSNLGLYRFEKKLFLKSFCQHHFCHFSVYDWLKVDEYSCVDQEPGPNVPAFSAISRALFRFWSKSSHLIGISKE